MAAAQTLQAATSLVGELNTLGKRGQFDLEEVVSFVKASSSKADELLRLICAWGDKNQKELEENGELVAAFTRLLGCIDVADLSQRAVDEFNHGFSHFGKNVACE